MQLPEYIIISVVVVYAAFAITFFVWCMANITPELEKMEHTEQTHTKPAETCIGYEARIDILKSSKMNDGDIIYTIMKELEEARKNTPEINFNSEDCEEIYSQRITINFE